MTIVELRPFFHRKQESISLHGNFKDELVRSVKNIRWSRTYRCWYLPCTRENFDFLKKHLGNKATLEYSALSFYLKQRRALLPDAQKVRVSTFKKIQGGIPNAANLDAYVKYHGMLTMKGYSSNTVNLYCNAFHRLLRLIKEKNINELTQDEIHAILLWLIKEEGCSEQYMHVLINALKFYFEKVLNRDPGSYYIPRPKKPLQLPTVLAAEEIVEMINMVKNVKHRCMLMTGYSAGLRVSEIVNLKVTDIDSKRMVISIRCAKGKKDRMVPLSRKLLLELREYFLQYRPTEYLFEGQDGGPYSARSAQQVIKDAKLRAGITKPGSMHSLRHSYATHLMEMGTDIRFIQELLGHNSVTTTMRYTHVSRKSIDQIASPLDRLDWGDDKPPPGL